MNLAFLTANLQNRRSRLRHLPSILTGCASGDESANDRASRWTAVHCRFW